MSKINFNDVASVENKDNIIIVEIASNKIEVKKSLNTNDFLSYVQLITDSCFDENEEYHAEYRAIATAYAWIKYYTNIDVSDVSASDVFDFVYSYEKLRYMIEDECQADFTIDRMIGYRLKMQKSSFDTLCDNLNSFVIMLSEKAESIDSNDIHILANKMNELNDTQIVESVMETFKKENDIGTNND